MRGRLPRPLRLLSPYAWGLILSVAGLAGCVAFLLKAWSA